MKASHMKLLTRQIPEVQSSSMELNANIRGPKSAERKVGVPVQRVCLGFKKARLAQLPTLCCRWGMGSHLAVTGR